MTMSTHPAVVRKDDPEERAAMLSRLWLDVRAVRRALVRGSSRAVEHASRGLLSSLANVRVRIELAYAAAAFADALEERPDAEAWVTFAVTARATLENAVRGGASALAEELAELDASYEDARDAVLLLGPQDYKEAVSGAPANSRGWWCERALLDGRLREIDLERALGLLSRA